LGLICLRASLLGVEAGQAERLVLTEAPAISTLGDSLTPIRRKIIYD